MQQWSIICHATNINILAAYINIFDEWQIIVNMSHTHTQVHQDFGILYLSIW